MCCVLEYCWLDNRKQIMLYVMYVPIQPQNNSIDQFLTSECLTSEFKCGNLLTTEQSVFVVSAP
jgi:hypothetical protein